jgi:hypothetical protein
VVKRRRPRTRHLRRARRRLLLRACVTPAWCADCRVNTTPCTIRRRRGDKQCPDHRGWELYMVTHDVWAAAGAPSEQHDFYLCVGCLERRLGRRLQPNDFMALSINDPSDCDSGRLADRKAGAIVACE